MKNDNRPSRPYPNTENGNALFFILIAVVLLGLLTMVLSRGSGTADQNSDTEQQRIKASQLIRYTKGIEAGVQKMPLDGCSENDISFENTVDTDYTNADSPDDDSCHVFRVGGAGLEWIDMTDQAFDSGEDLIFTGAIQVYGVENDTSHDLLALIPVSSGLCTQINKEMGNSNVAADIASNISAYTKFTGAFSGSGSIGNGAGKAPGLTSKQAGCFKDANADYVFYQVLLAR